MNSGKLNFDYLLFEKSRTNELVPRFSLYQFLIHPNGATYTPSSLLIRYHFIRFTSKTLDLVFLLDAIVFSDLAAICSALWLDVLIYSKHVKL